MSVRRVNLILACLVLLFVVLNHARLGRRLLYWYDGSVRIDGATFYVNPSDEVISRVMVNRGEWEPTVTAVILEHLGPGDVFVDVGANIGYYTVLASKRVGDSGRVIAFEPDPTSFELLRRNVEVNECTNVTLVQKALSNEPGTLTLFLDEHNKGAHRVHEFSGYDGSVEVEAVRLDDYLADHDLAIDLIKIDTEGAEGAIVEGMRETLQNQPTVKLVVEFFPDLLDEAGYDPKHLLDQLRSSGFQCHLVNEPEILLDELQSRGFEFAITEGQSREVLPLAYGQLPRLQEVLEEEHAFVNLFLTRRAEGDVARWGSACVQTALRE